MILADNVKLAKYIGTDSGLPFEVAQAITSKVKSDRTQRNIDVEKFWDMYKGNHSDYFRERRNEDRELFKYRKQHGVKANLCRYIVDLSAKYLYGRASKVSRKFGENKKTDEGMRKRLKQCNYEALMLESAKKGGIFGEQGVRLIPVDEVTMEQTAGKATATTYPHPITLDPIKTFFLLNRWGKINAVVIEDEYQDYAKGELHKTVELVTSDSRWFWDDVGNTQMSKPVPSIAELNTYNLNMEFVLFKNNDFWIDDIQDIVDLNIQLDEVLTDNAHFFAKHGWPQLVSSVDLSKVQHSSTHIWNVESEGPQDKIQDKLFFLQWDGRMVEAHTFAQYLEALIFKVSSTARIATGDLEAIGQLRSGPAIVAAHSPSIQKTQEKQVIWSANERALIHAIAAFDAFIHEKALETMYPELEPTIVFPADFAPGEELVRAEVDQIEISQHIATVRDKIRQRHPFFSEEQVNEYREELFDDSERLVDSLREFITSSDGEGGTVQTTKKPKGQSGSTAKKAQEQK